MAMRFRTSRPSRTLLPSLLLAASALTGSMLAGSALAQSSDVYQWKDAKGVTHYSDSPPAKGKYDSRVIEARKGTPAVASAEPRKPDPKAVANCSLARTNLTRLQAVGDIGLDADGDGQPDSTMSPQDRAKQTTLAEANIKTWCGSTGVPASP